MKRLLKYLLFLMVAAAFLGCADKNLPEVTASGIEDISFNSSEYSTDLSPTDSEFNLPRQTSFANSHRVQSTVRRTNSIHRNNVEFAKSGKVINAGLGFFIRLQSLIIRSALAEPSHRLLCLCRLII